MCDIYKIEGTKNLHPEQSSGAYLDPNWWPTFQEDKENFKKKLIECRNKKIPFTVMKLSHAEYDLLDFIIYKKELASRRLSDGRPIPKEDYIKYYESIISCDIMTIQIGYDFKKWMNNVKNYKNNYIEYKEKNDLDTLLNNPKLFLSNHKEYTQHELMDFPMDILYGMVANKWFFRNFKNKIGLIGAEEKLNCIKDLMKYKKYQEYLGTDYFTDYIPVKQKYSIHDEELEERIKAGVLNSKCDIFLIGVATSKLKFYHFLKDIKNCIYVDVGTGIDLIAGFGDLNRPYCGNWNNYRIRRKNYKNIDLLGLNHKNIIYL